MADAGRLLVLLGVLLVLAGLGLLLAGRLPLPANFAYRRGGLTFIAPVGAMLLVSILLTLVLNVLLRIGR